MNARIPDFWGTEKSVLFIEIPLLVQKRCQFYW